MTRTCNSQFLDKDLSFRPYKIPLLMVTPLFFHVCPVMKFQKFLYFVVNTFQLFKFSRCSETFINVLQNRWSENVFTFSFKVSAADSFLVKITPSQVACLRFFLRKYLGGNGHLLQSITVRDRSHITHAGRGLGRGFCHILIYFGIFGQNLLSLSDKGRRLHFFIFRLTSYMNDPLLY